MAKKKMKKTAAKKKTAKKATKRAAPKKVAKKMKAKAKLSDELVGSDTAQIESEIMAAGMSGDAMDEFNKMLAESEMKAQERAQSSPQTERTM